MTIPWWLLVVACAVVWAPAVVLGSVLGRRAVRPAGAFWRGLIVASGAVAFLAMLAWPVIPGPATRLKFALLLFGLPPGLLAGVIAAVSCARIPPRGAWPSSPGSRVSPDVEEAARTHFRAPSAGQVPDAIRPPGQDADTRLQEPENGGAII
jgi:hypothetical protein